MEHSQLPYVSADEFNSKVEELVTTNYVLKTLFNNPKSGIKTWEQLPPHLIDDLFKKLGCKPDIRKY